MSLLYFLKGNSMEKYIEVTHATEIEYIKTMIDNEIFIKKRLIDKLEAARTLNDEQLKEWFAWAKTALIPFRFQDK